MGKVAYKHAEACPKCGASIIYLKAVGTRTLDAARCVLAGYTTAATVATQLQMTVTQASDALRRAAKAQLVKITHRELRDRGGYAYHYAATQRLRAYVPVEYHLAQNSQRRAS